MIRPGDVPAIAAALRAEHWRFVGVRPLETNPSPSSPCVLLGEPTLTSLDYALQEALAMWPHCPDWELIGSDVELKHTFANNPRAMEGAPESVMSPRGRLLERPARMTVFHLAQ